MIPHIRRETYYYPFTSNNYKLTFKRSSSISSIMESVEFTGFSSLEAVKAACRRSTKSFLFPEVLKPRFFNSFFKSGT